MPVARSSEGAVEAPSEPPPERIAPAEPALERGARPGPPRLFHGWIVVAGAFLILFMAYGTQYAFGVFFAALIDAFGWSRASLSGVFSLYAFTYAAFALVSGRLTDRWGPRVVIAIGGVLLGLGLIAMSRVSALWQPDVCYGLVANALALVFLAFVRPAASRSLA